MHVVFSGVVYSLQIFVRNVTLESQDAADVVLLIDDSGSMNLEHEWLLVMIPLLEEMLVDAGSRRRRKGGGNITKDMLH